MAGRERDQHSEGREAGCVLRRPHSRHHDRGRRAAGRGDERVSTENPYVQLADGERKDITDYADHDGDWLLTVEGGEVVSLAAHDARPAAPSAPATPPVAPGTSGVGTGAGGPRGE